MIISPIEGKLSLKNDGALEIVFLGVGSAFAKDYFQTNLLIIKGDSHVLVDFGTTGPIALRQHTGLSTTDIEYFLPTHSHADHIGGVEYLALMNRYVAVGLEKRKKLKTIITEDYQHELWEHSLRGGLEWNEEYPSGVGLSFNDYFDVVRPKLIGDEPRFRWDVSVGSIRLEMFRTNHIPGSAISPNRAAFTVGILIDDLVFFSGDTKFDASLIDLYRNRAKFFFHDASAFPNPVHACVSELSALDADLKKKMILVHYPDLAPEQLGVEDFYGWAQEGVRYIFP